MTARVDKSIDEVATALERRDVGRREVVVEVLTELEKLGIVDFKPTQPQHVGAMVRTEKRAQVDAFGVGGEIWTRWTADQARERPWMGALCGEVRSWRELTALGRVKVISAGWTA